MQSPTKSLFFALCALFFTVLACKTQSHHPYPDSDDQPSEVHNNKNTVELKISVGNRFENLFISKKPSSTNALHFMAMEDIDSIKQQNMEVLEFDENGQLITVTDHNVTLPNCYSFALIPYEVNSFTRRTILVAPLSSETAKHYPSSAQFTYCVSEASFKTATIENYTKLKSFFIERERVPTDSTLQLTGSFKSVASSDSASSSKRRSRASASADNAAKKSASVGEIPELKKSDEVPLEGPRHPEPPAAKAPTPAPDSKPLFAGLDELRTKSIESQGSWEGNEAELKFYKENILPRMEVLETLGQGSFAVVNKVKIGDDYYALRVEDYSGTSARSKAETIIKKRAERLNFLVVNKFAEAYPHLPFLRTMASFIDENGRFVTILPLREGGEVMKGLNRASRTTRQEWAKDISEQLQIFRKGIPYTITGSDGGTITYTLEFQHADLKPENFLLGSDNRASIVDFGFSMPILKRQLSDGSFEYKMFAHTEKGVELKDLALKVTTAADGSTYVSKVFGTPYYLSREMYSPKSSYSPEEVYHFLRDNDAHAHNASLYYMKYGKQYLATTMEIYLMRTKGSPKLTKLKEIVEFLTKEASLDPAVRTSAPGARPLLQWDDFESDGKAIRFALLYRWLKLSSAA